jgi:multicomponent Na+:H+ antiporter subunit B
MIGAHPSEVVRVVCALLSPFIALFGLYVIAHGHYGPGGGFAGGVFVAVGAILPRLTLPEQVAFALVKPSLGPLAGGVGLLLFVLCGVAPMLFGGAFLDYGAIEIAGMSEPRVRYLGILVVEIGVGLAVFGAMLLIFDVLTGGDDRDPATPRVEEDEAR